MAKRENLLQRSYPFFGSNEEERRRKGCAFARVSLFCFVVFALNLLVWRRRFNFMGVESGIPAGEAYKKEGGK